MDEVSSRNPVRPVRQRLADDSRKKVVSVRKAGLLCAVLVSLFPQAGLTQSSAEVIEKPDAFAWKLFLELNRPADPTRPGEADPAKKLGEPGETVWETWKLANDVFREDGCKPQAWGAEQLEIAGSSRFVEPASKAALILRELLPKNEFAALFDPKEPSGETRMNKDAFEFIVANGLYNIDGQENFHQQEKAIDLPKEAKEIKSGWKLLTEDELKRGARDRYHVAELDGQVYGLVALHIITKDIPQWFWSTFEHVDNPDIDVRRGERFFDRYTDGGRNLPQEVKNTKWEFYRLKGTQTEYVTLTGESTVLANAIIERGFQGTSSCVSCHAHASIGPQDASLAGQANRLPIFPSVSIRRFDETDPSSRQVIYITGWTGTPDPKRFSEPFSGRKRYTQTDFMWSFFRASRRSSACKD